MQWTDRGAPTAHLSGRLGGSFVIDLDPHRWAGSMVACSAQYGAMGLLAAALAVGSTARQASAQIPCGYEVAAVIKGPFCSPFGYPTTIPRDIGEDGTVVGHYNVCTIGPSAPFRWTKETGLVTLGLPGGFASGSAFAIDDQTGKAAGAMILQGKNRPTAAPRRMPAAMAGCKNPLTRIDDETNNSTFNQDHDYRGCRPVSGCCACSAGTRLQSPTPTCETSICR